MIDLVEVPVSHLHRLPEILPIRHHAGFEHLAEQVVALAGAFADASEHRQPLVRLGNVVDELLNEHRLTHAGSPEQPHLASSGDRLHEIDHLDARFQHLYAGGEILESGGGPVDRAPILHDRLRQAVDGTTHHVEQPPTNLSADRHRDGPARVHDLGTAREAVGRIHRDGSHAAFAHVLLHLEHQRICVIAFNGECIQNAGESTVRKLRIHDRTDDLNNSAVLHVPICRGCRKTMIWLRLPHPSSCTGGSMGRTRRQSPP